MAMDLEHWAEVLDHELREVQGVESVEPWNGMLLVKVKKMTEMAKIPKKKGGITVRVEVL